MLYIITAVVAKSMIIGVELLVEVQNQILLILN
jgi:hypothetical protein